MAGNTTQLLPNLLGKWAGTDSQMDQMWDAIKDTDERQYEPVTESFEYKQGKSLLGEIEEWRVKTRDLLCTPSESFAYYTTMNAMFSDVQIIGAVAVRENSVDYALISYVAVAKGVELLSEIRQMGLLSITGGGFKDLQTYSDFVGLTYKQDTYIEIFSTFVNPEVESFHQESVNSSCLTISRELRDVLRDGNDTHIADLDSAMWYNNMTCLIDIYTSVEENLNGFLVETSETSMRNTVSMMIGLMIGLVVLICWTSFLVFGIVFSSSAPTKILNYLDREFFRVKVSFQTQIMIALAFPSVIVLVLFMTQVSYQVKEVQYNAELVNHLETLEVMSKMVHEFQEERDVSSIYYESYGQQYITALGDQWKVTDEKRQTFFNFIENNPSEVQETPAFLDALALQEEIIEFRYKVWEVYDLNSTAQVREFYTDLIDKYLEVYVELVQISRKDDFYFDLLAFTMYTPGKERSGAERAKGVSGFQNDGWVDFATFNSFMYFSESQQPYLELARYYFTEEQRNFEKFEFEQGDRSQDVALQQEWRLQLLSMEHAQMNTTDHNEWFAKCTTRINVMLDVLGVLDAALEEETDQFARKSSLAFQAACVVIISSFVFSDNFTTLIMWRLVKLREIARNVKFTTAKQKKRAQSKRRRRKR